MTRLWLLLVICWWRGGQDYDATPARGKVPAMKRDDAQQSIILEWDIWAAINLVPGVQTTGADGLIFFGYLQKHRPGLLNFRNRGDKWHTVHGWLFRARKVKNRQAPSQA
jgi:hypothetical protein